jgi:hypothetical protein
MRGKLGPGYASEERPMRPNLRRSRPNWRNLPGGCLLVFSLLAARASGAGVLPAVIITKGAAALIGNGISSDSYDSSDPNKSTNGQYNPSLYQGDRGDIISAGGLTNSIAVGNGSVYGRVHTTAAATPSVGSNGGIGSHAWQTINRGIEPGWWLQDAGNVTYPDIVLPNTTGFLAPSASPTNIYDYVLHTGGRYVASSLAGKKVWVEGPAVTLVLPNGLAGTERFIWNQGASLVIYAGGASNLISAGSFINPNPPASCLLLCTPEVVTLALAGTGPFQGVVVAPNADAVLGGGGSSIVDFCGSLMLNSLRLNGHYNFHYDESLASLYLPGQIVQALLTKAGRTVDGLFGFSVNGVAGASYAVQSSTDLVTWTSLTTNTSPFTFTDPDATNTPQKFYRTVSVP